MGSKIIVADLYNTFDNKDLPLDYIKLATAILKQAQHDYVNGYQEDVESWLYRKKKLTSGSRMIISFPFICEAFGYDLGTARKRFIKEANKLKEQNLAKEVLIKARRDYANGYQEDVKNWLNSNQKYRDHTFQEVCKALDYDSDSDKAKSKFIKEAELLINKREYHKRRTKKLSRRTKKDSLEKMVNSSK